MNPHRTRTNRPRCSRRPSWPKLDELDAYKKGVKAAMKRRKCNKCNTHKKGVEQARNRRKSNEMNAYKKGVQRYGSATEQQPNRNGNATAEPGKNQGRNNGKVTARDEAPGLQYYCKGTANYNGKFTVRVATRLQQSYNKVTTQSLPIGTTTSLPQGRGEGYGLMMQGAR